MTTPTIVPDGFLNDATDFNKVKHDTFGAERIVEGTVSVLSGTATGEFIGLVPFNAGAVFTVNNGSVHVGDFGAATTVVDLGIIYDDDANNTNDPNAWVIASTEAQSGGFLTVGNPAGLTIKTTANGWLTVGILVADADATADITFNIGVKYD